MIVSTIITDSYCCNSSRWIYWSCRVCYTCTITSFGCTTIDSVTKSSISSSSDCMSSQYWIIDDIDVSTICYITLNCNRIAHCKMILTNVVQCVWRINCRSDFYTTSCCTIEVCNILSPCNCFTVNFIYNSFFIPKWSTISILTCRKVYCMDTIRCVVLIKCISQSTRHRDSGRLSYRSILISSNVISTSMSISI